MTIQPARRKKKVKIEAKKKDFYSYWGKSFEFTVAASQILMFAALALLFFSFSRQGFRQLSALQTVLFLGIFAVTLFLIFFSVLTGFLRRQAQKPKKIFKIESDNFCEIDRFKRIVARESKRAGRYHLPMTLCFLDIDQCRERAARRGLQRDDLLQHFAAFIVKLVRGSDYFVHCGNDEFAILLCHTDVSHGQYFIYRLFLQSQEHLDLSFSSGLTGYRSGETAETFFERAREALTVAKKEGFEKIQCAIGLDDSPMIKNF